MLTVTLVVPAATLTQFVVMFVPLLYIRYLWLKALLYDVMLITTLEPAVRFVLLSGPVLRRW